MSFAASLQAELDQFRADGVYKRLNYLDSPQGPRARMEGHGEVVILSSNNYLGLCNAPEVVAAGKADVVHANRDDPSAELEIALETLELSVPAHPAPARHAPFLLGEASRWTTRTERSAGVTPEIREACPSEHGLTFESFSRDSARIPVTRE